MNDYICPSCFKPIFPVDLSKLIIDSKYIPFDKHSKYYYCERCKEREPITQTLIKEEDLIKLKNHSEDSIPEITMHLIMINCKPAFIVTVEVKEFKRG